MTSNTDSDHAETIRLKRLAKLEQPNTSGGSSPTSSPAISLTPPPMPNEPVVPKIKLASSTGQPSPSTGVTKTFEDWENDALCRVLRLTLDSKVSMSQGDRVIFLQDLAQELDSEEPAHVPRPFKLSSVLIDRALVARMSLDPSSYSMDENENTLYDYLLGCWRRASELRKGTQSRAAKMPDAPRRIKALDDVKALVVSYSGLVLQYPDTFPQNATPEALGPLQMLPGLMVDPESPKAIPVEFLQDLVERFADDGLETIFGPILTGISAVMNSQTILTDYRSPLRAFSILMEFKAIAAMVTTLPNWNPPNTDARSMETLSLMGPFLRLTLYPSDEPAIAHALFANAESRNDISSAISSLRGAFASLETALFSIFNAIIRSSAQSREGVLSYLATILAKNRKRAQMQVDRKTVSTDGFMTNIIAVLLNLCDPFMDPGYSKISKIDNDYLRRCGGRIDVKEDTKMFASQEESDMFYGQGTAAGSGQAPPNFITEIFNITAAFMHYGFLRSFFLYKNFLQDLSELKKQYERLKADRPNWISTPQGPQHDNLLGRMKAQLDKALSHKLALEAQILDPRFLSHSLQFMNLTAAWMIRLATLPDDKAAVPAVDYPRETVKLPLKEEPSMVWRCLPEWFAEDITEFFLFLSRFSPITITSGSRNELVDFLLIFLHSPKYIKNPYLRAKFVEIIFYFTLPFRGEPEGGLGAHLNGHPLCLEHLVPAIMRFYVEVEQTGAHSQFYDKFNIRYNISQILKAVWDTPAHREKVRQESRETESFVRFVNLLMNDTTYLLDESLSKLAEIHAIQTEMDDPDWSGKPLQYRQERETLLRTDERQAASYIALGNETVHLLSYLTEEIVEPFLSPEIVDRLASMLDYNLAGMVGPKCTNLKVKDPEKYRFQPRVLLSELVDIYLHLSSRREFVLAVARDGRSYNKEWFSKAAAVMLKYRLKSQDDVDKLAEFVSRVEGTITTDMQVEDELGEAPDEFLDPLMYTVMEDPVILPTSNVTIDRSTIKSHLLSDVTDPFNRKPLSIDMVIPDVALKAKIEEWRNSKSKH